MARQREMQWTQKAYLLMQEMRFLWSSLLPSTGCNIKSRLMVKTSNPPIKPHVYHKQARRPKKSKGIMQLIVIGMMEKGRRGRRPRQAVNRQDVPTEPVSTQNATSQTPHSMPMRTAKLTI
ncbi:unnamed protein product [Prunus armeniaca]|uniref:Uncharacterized protein n=1 Tax=Prunus armeniaca TaxID=36596 RepID=A0A6J5VX71_PRUAR|nr:unnamed protein product [Prunus armeniaca]